MTRPIQHQLFLSSTTNRSDMVKKGVKYYKTFFSLSLRLRKNKLERL
jgi:hypothetical protein